MSRINFLNPDDFFNLPLPVAHSDFDFTAKTLRDLGIGEGRAFRRTQPLDTEHAERAVRLVWEQMERWMLGRFCPVIYFEDP